MGKYNIKLEYSTGNSFHTEETEDIIELSWDNLDIVKANLVRIKEHYEMYLKLNTHFRKKLSNREIIAENIGKDWLVVVPAILELRTNCYITKDCITKRKLTEDQWKEVPNEYEAECCINLYADNGNKMQMRAFWCGYFEHLHSAEIVMGEDSDMKFEF